MAHSTSDRGAAMLQEYQRLELLRIMEEAAVSDPGSDWWKDLPTMADRIMKSGQVTVTPRHFNKKDDI